jgi:diguanylate cyclase (GGDEF)-like protein
MFLDLDAFKVVNDRLGHRAGDELLRIIAGRIARSVRGSDVVARYGGDEFLVLATADEREDLLVLAERLVGIVNAPVRLGELTVAQSTSLGVAFIAPDDTPDTAIRDADGAMYLAKSQGGGRVAVHERGGP